MHDPWHQLSDSEETVAATPEPWGWLEIFVISQVFWGVLLFIPGSQAYRIYIRAFPYVSSLFALLACLKSASTDLVVPGARWIIAVVFLLVLNLLHDETWFTAGLAQVVFQIAIAAPVFWASRAWMTERRLKRVILLIFAANFVSAALGLLQVYFPDTFLPPEFSTLAFKLNPDFLGGLTYRGANDRLIIRPPGLSDLPGGAAISATITALLGFSFAFRRDISHMWKGIFFGSVLIGTTVVFLTQVRSMLLMIVGCIIAISFVRLRQGRVVQSGWIAASAAVVVLSSFVWAAALGGEVVESRYRDIVDTGFVRTYQENRGYFLAYTLEEMSWEYPFGAGLGRWGMMSALFVDSQKWQHPALYAELQITGWLYDGGVLMWILYPGALIVAMRHSYKVATRNERLHENAVAILALQLLLAGLCFTGPVFNTQVGMIFWMMTALLYGAERTDAVEVWQHGEAPNVQYAY